MAGGGWDWAYIDVGAILIYCIVCYMYFVKNMKQFYLYFRLGIDSFTSSMPRAFSSQPTKLSIILSLLLGLSFHSWLFSVLPKSVSRPSTQKFLKKCYTSNIESRALCTSQQQLPLLYSQMLQDFTG